VQSLNKKFITAILILLIFGLQSCSSKYQEPFDRVTGATRQDMRDLLTKNREKEKEEKEKIKKSAQKADIPKVSKLILAPPPPAIGGEKLISFSATDQAPLKDVLIELGRVSNIDIDVDPKISGGINISAKNKPLKEIINRIATQGNLRYSYKNGVLFFQSGNIYIKNYFVDYLTDGSLWSDVESNITSLLALEMPVGEDGTPSFTTNKSAGMITIYASESSHRIIQDYLKEVEKYASAQVLIEAKIVEVSLTDNYKTGINWSDATGDTTFSLTNTVSDSAFTLVAGELFGSDLNATVNALEEFGSTKTLSSPRLHAMNNQKATLNFADKLVYFEISNNQAVTTTSGNTPVTEQTLSTTKVEENVGVELEITPSINLETKEVTLNLKPKVSVRSDTVTDPASQVDEDGNVVTSTANQIPVIQTREINTVAKIKSGNVFVIGGLMKEEADNNERGTPFLQRIPILGWLFKSVIKTSKVTETVIFVKATIVNSSSTPGKADRDLQQGLDPNRRKFF
jgi:general secretion pathway protein D